MSNAANTIQIRDKTLTLVFDTAAWVDVEKTFGSMDRMYKRMEEDVLPMITGLQLAAFAATSGTCDRKKKEEITFDWLVENASPAKVREIIRLAKEEVLKGMESHESLFEDEGPVDVGLEEDDAKKTRADA